MNYYLIPVAGLIGLIVAFLKSSWISRQDEGSEQMKKIGAAINNGAMAFLKAEYKVLSVFVIVVAVLLGVMNMGKDDSSVMISFSFIVGAVCSALAGYLGMKVATKSNYRTTHAARTGLSPALLVAFTGGSVMGLSVVGLGVAGLGVLFIVYQNMWGMETSADVIKILNVVTGFSLGASSIALFARVGGGIYTKAADVGADLVGKVEAGIPEDHPLNPATIADNVGDNVGDVAGMGADLFESYIGSIIGSMILGIPFISAFNKVDGVKEGGDPQKALNIGEFGSSAIMIVVFYFIITNMLPEEMELYRSFY